MSMENWPLEELEWAIRWWERLKESPVERRAWSVREIVQLDGLLDRAKAIIDVRYALRERLGIRTGDHDDSRDGE